MEEFQEKPLGLQLTQPLFRTRAGSSQQQPDVLVSLLSELDSGLLEEEEEKPWVVTPHPAPKHALFITARAVALQSAN